MINNPCIAREKKLVDGEIEILKVTKVKTWNITREIIAIQTKSENVYHVVNSYRNLTWEFIMREIKRVSRKVK